MSRQGPAGACGRESRGGWGLNAGWLGAILITRRPLNQPESP